MRGKLGCFPGTRNKFVAFYHPCDHHSLKCVPADVLDEGTFVPGMWSSMTRVEGQAECFFTRKDREALAGPFARTGKGCKWPPIGAIVQSDRRFYSILSTTSGLAPRLLIFASSHSSRHRRSAGSEMKSPRKKVSWSVAVLCSLFHFCNEQQ